MVEVHVNIEDHVHLSGKGEQYRKELLNQVSSDGRLIMESVTPRRTSRGANSYRIIKKANVHEIRNDVFYLPFVNEGTGLYGPLHRRITPVHAKVLHFHWKGQEWFLPSVRGQKPRKFVERGVQDIVRSIEKASIIAANKTLK
ncbi:MAG: hypothetical protein IJ104_04270 [Methanobrevibacter sp.]|nr:hypothetical protein [Methanobrevibacter sp.]